MKDQPDSRRFTAIVLAAGRGERLGGGKLGLPWGDNTILGTVLATLRDAGATDILVVLGHQPELLQPIVTAAGARGVVNREFDRGMLTSVQCGLRHVENVKGVLLLPGDQPLVRADTCRAVAAALVPPAGFVIPRCNDRGGHPVAIAADLFATVLELDPTVGLRQLRDRAPDRVRYVEVDDPGIGLDIDTPDDYRAMAPGK
jgi:CTP:molybdopterin cytidylyltransferase MocA